MHVISTKNKMSAIQIRRVYNGQKSEYSTYVYITDLN